MRRTWSPAQAIVGGRGSGSGAIMGPACPRRADRAIRPRGGEPRPGGNRQPGHQPAVPRPDREGRRQSPRVAGMGDGRAVLWLCGGDLPQIARTHGRWMVWNLALAAVPVFLAMALFRPGRRHGVGWWLGTALFVLFLPNAPYVLTDVVHLFD